MLANSMRQITKAYQFLLRIGKSKIHLDQTL